MKVNSLQKQDLEKYFDFPVIVEGKKDIISLRKIGFGNIFAIHKTRTSLRESIENICAKIGKDEKACIFTDFDRKGKYFHAQLKQILQENGITVDSSLRKLLAKEGISHVEGLDKFIENQHNS